MRTRPYSTVEVARILGVTTATVRNMVEDGRLAAFRTGEGGQYRVWPDALARFVREHEVETAREEGGGDAEDRTDGGTTAPVR